MNDKIKDLEELKKRIASLKSVGKKIVTTNGSFDVLHLAHAKILEEAKSFGDVLVVLVNSDESIKKFKGDKRPIVPENERAEILSYLNSVDYVIIFHDDKPLKMLAEIKPDIHVKGGTFIDERVKEERELLESWGGIHKILPLKEGYSTTNLISKILDAYK